MPAYDYRCTRCNLDLEVEHKMSEKPSVVCPTCGKQMEKTFAASGVVFKGSGFFNTDNRPSPKKEEERSESKPVDLKSKDVCPSCPAASSCPASAE